MLVSPRNNRLPVRESPSSDSPQMDQPAGQACKGYGGTTIGPMSWEASDQRRNAKKPPIPVAFLRVRPAWAHSYGCKSRHKLVTASEVKRNCMRATECGEEAWIEAAGR